MYISLYITNPYRYEYGESEYVGDRNGRQQASQRHTWHVCDAFFPAILETHGFNCLDK